MPVLKDHDVIAQAQSGTGKTATFSVSVLQKIDHTVKQCQALILAPTRELAQQIQKVVIALGDYLDIEVLIFNGLSDIFSVMLVLVALLFAKISEFSKKASMLLWALLVASWTWSKTVVHFVQIISRCSFSTRQTKCFPYALTLINFLHTAWFQGPNLQHLPTSPCVNSSSPPIRHNAFGRPWSNPKIHARSHSHSCQEGRAHTRRY